MAYAFELLPNDYFVSVVVYVFLAAIVVYGIWMALTSSLALRKTRRIQKKIVERKRKVMAQSSEARSFSMTSVSLDIFCYTGNRHFMKSVNSGPILFRFSSAAVPFSVKWKAVFLPSL